MYRVDFILIEKNVQKERKTAASTDRIKNGKNYYFLSFCYFTIEHFSYTSHTISQSCLQYINMMMN